MGGRGAGRYMRRGLCRMELVLQTLCAADYSEFGFSIVFFVARERARCFSPFTAPVSNSLYSLHSYLRLLFIAIAFSRLFVWSVESKAHLGFCLKVSRNDKFI